MKEKKGESFKRQKGSKENFTKKIKKNQTKKANHLLVNSLHNSTESCGKSQNCVCV